MASMKVLLLGLLFAIILAISSGAVAARDAPEVAQTKGVQVDGWHGGGGHYGGGGGGGGHYGGGGGGGHYGGGGGHYGGGGGHCKHCSEEEKSGTVDHKEETSKMKEAEDHSGHCHGPHC